MNDTSLSMQRGILVGLFLGAEMLVVLAADSPALDGQLVGELVAAGMLPGVMLWHRADRRAVLAWMLWIAAILVVGRLSGAYDLTLFAERCSHCREPQDLDVTLRAAVAVILICMFVGFLWLAAVAHQRRHAANVPDARIHR